MALAELVATHPTGWIHTCALAAVVFSYLRYRWWLYKNERGSCRSLGLYTADLADPVVRAWGQRRGLAVALVQAPEVVALLAVGTLFLIDGWHTGPDGATALLLPYGMWVWITIGAMVWSWVGGVITFAIFEISRPPGARDPFETDGVTRP